MDSAPGIIIILCSCQKVAGNIHQLSQMVRNIKSRRSDRYNNPELSRAKWHSSWHFRNWWVGVAIFKRFSLNFFLFVCIAYDIYLHRLIFQCVYACLKVCSGQDKRRFITAFSSRDGKVSAMYHGFHDRLRCMFNCWEGVTNPHAFTFNFNMK